MPMIDLNNEDEVKKYEIYLKTHWKFCANYDIIASIFANIPSSAGSHCTE